METLNASEAKREFGEALIKAQQGPVGINKNGKTVAVMISAKAYAELQSYRELHLQREIEAGIADIKAGRVTDGKALIQRMVKHVVDANL